MYTFVEKFYSCYRDSLNGGRDMRYFSALYFLMRPVMIILYVVRVLRVSNTYFYAIIIFISVALVIAFVKPYKKTFMSFSDTVLLALVALFCLLSSFSLKYTFVGGISMLIFLFSPMFVFIIVISVRFIRMLKTYLCIANCQRNISEERHYETSDTTECQRLLDSTQNKMSHYGGI